MSKTNNDDRRVDVLKIRDAQINSHKMFGHTQLSTLPEELLLRIFKLLPHSDLTSLLLVNKKFSNLASDPVLWRLYHIPAMEIAQLSGLDVLEKVLQLPRFSKLQVLDLSRVLAGVMRRNGFKPFEQNSAISQQFQDILITASSLPLKRLDLSYNNLAAIPAPDLLSKLVLSFEHVELAAVFRGRMDRGDDWIIINQILLDILEEISDTSVLRNVDLSYCELDSLPVPLISKLNCLTKVSLEGSFMTAEQVKALLMEMGRGSNIVKLDLGCESIIDVETLSDALESVEPEVMAKALNNVEYLVYNKVNFMTDGECDEMEPDVYLAAFLEEMGRRTKLKKLDMRENNYFHVNPVVVGKAFNNLQYIEFQPNPAITTAQIVEILKQMALKTNVVYLKFSYEDISWLNPGLVARAVVQVEQVDMCKMSRAHIMAILAQIDNNSKIKGLNLGGNDVSRVPESFVTKAVGVMRKNGGTVLVKKRQKKTFLSYKKEVGSLGF